MSFTCLHCLRVQPDDNICADCNALMDPGSLCRCGERIAATGADECVACICDEVRLDPAELNAMREPLRGQVLAQLRAEAKPSYHEGFLSKRQVGGMK